MTSQVQPLTQEILSKAEAGHSYRCSKTYNHSVGLSCVFRQWRSDHSHCQYLHGYALKVEIVFEALQLDERNWVQDFGGLKTLKAWLEETFDHKTLVAEDDPELARLSFLQTARLAQVVIVPSTGVEAFARLIWEQVKGMLDLEDQVSRVRLNSVTVAEHDGNSATYGVAL